MKRLILIVEGDSEKEFVTKVLSPFFYSKNIYNIECFKIKHSKGGLSKYSHLKKDILNVIYENNAIVTTLIDFYALPHDFPKFKDSESIIDKTKKLSFLEDAIKKDIESSQNKIFPNLIPYIQLHEFEAFIFSSIKGIESLFETSEANFEALQKVINEYPNPEDINENPNTAPSKRLLKNIKGYNKVVDGVSIIEEIGIEIIIQKCPRFSYWVNSLIHSLYN